MAEWSLEIRLSWFRAFGVWLMSRKPTAIARSTGTLSLLPSDAWLKMSISFPGAAYTSCLTRDTISA